MKRTEVSEQEWQDHRKAVIKASNRRRNRHMHGLMGINDLEPIPGWNQKAKEEYQRLSRKYAK